MMHNFETIKDNLTHMVREVDNKKVFSYVFTCCLFSLPSFFLGSSLFLTILILIINISFIAYCCTYIIKKYNDIFYKHILNGAFMFVLAIASISNSLIIDIYMSHIGSKLIVIILVIVILCLILASLTSMRLINKDKSKNKRNTIVGYSTAAIFGYFSMRFLSGIIQDNISMFIPVAISLLLLGIFCYSAALYLIYIYIIKKYKL